MSASEKPVQTQPASRSQPATSQISSASISGGGRRRTATQGLAKGTRLRDAGPDARP